MVNSLSALTHHFLSVDKTAYKISPGGAGYELTYAVSAVLPYLQSLSPSGDIDDAFSLIAAHEQKLLTPLIGYLTSVEARARGILIVGSEIVDTWRAPTISFVVSGERPIPSQDIVAHFDKKGKVRFLETQGLRFTSSSPIDWRSLRPLLRVHPRRRAAA